MSNKPRARRTRTLGAAYRDLATVAGTCPGCAVIVDFEDLGDGVFRVVYRHQHGCPAVAEPETDR